VVNIKIVKFKGGLGNQLFQYSFSRYLQIHSGEKSVKIDFSWFEALNPASKLTIERLNVRFEKATSVDIKKLCGVKNPFKPKTLPYKLFVATESAFNPHYYFSKKNEFLSDKKITHYRFFDGYFQDWRYSSEIRNELLKEISPKADLPKKVTDIIELIKTQNAVFIGVRLGDYLNEQDRYGILDETYYNTAIAFIKDHVQNPIFYVFSNDVPKVKTSLAFSVPVIFLADTVQLSDFDELMIMKNCHHAIIPRSTFHWWAAWLIQSENKIVVTPKPWFINGENIDIIPPEWHEI